MTEETEEETYNVYQLANMADCAGPDTNTSPGAHWLEVVATDALDMIAERAGEDIEDQHDRIHEMADGLVPVYTYEKWQVFTDLAAWQEDVTEYGEITDMEQGAGIALFMIAERLIRAIIEDRKDAADDDDEDE